MRRKGDDMGRARKLKEQRQADRVAERERAYDELAWGLTAPGIGAAGIDSSPWLRTSWLLIGSPVGLRERDLVALRPGDPFSLRSADPIALVRERLVLAALHALASRVGAILRGDDADDIDRYAAGAFVEGLSDAVVLVVYGMECGTGVALDDRDLSSADSVAASAATELASNRVAAVRKALIAAEGASKSFARLYAGLHGGRLTAGALDEILNGFSADTVRAFEWWTDGE